MTNNKHTLLRSNRLSALILGAGVFSMGAQAEQVIVQLRSPNTFHALSRNLQSSLAKRSTLGVFDAKASLPRIPNSTAPVTQTLDQLNMVVVEVNSPEELAALQNNPEVEMAEQEMFFPAPRPLNSEASTYAGRRRTRVRSAESTPWGITAVRAPEAWSSITTGSAGSGATVAILDTGIDKGHPDLANRFLAGKNFFTKTMEKAMAKIGGLFSTDILRTATPTPSEDSTYDYYDQNGHGTHVAGTIAGEANGVGVVGVAPQARLLAGRVCGKFGCSSVAIVNGINWAMQQGADVISMSLGGPMGSKAQKDALAQADAAGVIAVAASGNDGSAKVSFPAAFSTVIAVGAVDSTLTRADFSQYGPELAVMAPGVDVMSSVPVGSGRAAQVFVYSSGSAVEVKSTSFVGSPEVSTQLTSDLVDAGIGKPEQFTSAVRGKIALIKRGEIPFADKVKNAIEAGASAVVVYNHEAGLISGALTQDGSTVAIPVVMIEKTEGDKLQASLASGKAEKLSMATLRTDYASFQGTSMATPHVSGVVALIRAANKNLTPAQVRTLLVQTSTALKSTPDNQYGAGIVNAEAAVAAALHL